MRYVVITVSIALLLASPMVTLAATFTACWTSAELNPLTGIETPITRCRIAGGETVDYASDDVVPSVLYPNLGSDVTGQCWYLTSAATNYVILDRFADGSANIGLDTDPSTPGGIVAIGPVLPRCTSEPTPASDPATEAWEYVMSYIHDPPKPDLSPRAGDGVTGMETFVALDVPDRHEATLSAGASTIEVDIDVAAVVVDWGDGSIETFPAEPEVFTGHPSGAARHVYETKTADGSSIVIEYDWAARWRIIGGPWSGLPVPNTSTSVTYPVSEIVSRLDA